MVDRPLVLMAVHAHPDDEATGTGGVLAKYAAEGIETVLVTCTDGGCGDGPGGIKPADPAHDAAVVVALRAEELRRSAEILGVTHLEQLGYADSGMLGWPQNEAPHAFWNTPVAEAAQRLAELMRRYRPDVVVTYDEYGFYGHPDHIQAHRITMAAVEATGVPAKVYWTTVPRSAFAQFQKVFEEFAPAGAELPEADPDAPQVGVPDEEVTTFVDVAAFGKQKFAALEAHASQGENILFLQMGQERFTELMGVETFLRVRDSTGAALPEDDLFAGLR